MFGAYVRKIVIGGITFWRYREFFHQSREKTASVAPTNYQSSICRTEIDQLGQSIA